MKIKVKKISFEKLEKIPVPKHKKPLKQLVLLRLIVKLISAVNLKLLGFKYERIGMEKCENEPCLVIMNHSSFVDLEIAANLLWKKPFSIVCTSDAFVGLYPVLRLLGCIPTKKFVSTPTLIADMKYTLKTNKSNVLMYPEASYSFDGTATPLPKKLGLLLKRLDVPVCMITAKGAFLRQPLYNCLKLRKVPISAKMECILSREEIKEMSVDELDKRLDDAFSFDHFRTQREEKTKISEPFRADGLERILYKCPHCRTENAIKGEGVTVKCNNCGAEYELTVYGELKCINNLPKFDHIPDWYAWERTEVKAELLSGSYYFDEKVKILCLVDYKAIYDIGKGRLTHSSDGFRLTGCDGKLEFTLPPTACYGLYADYHWYEIGDVICIGNSERLYYCLPENKVSVAKVRLATEELYKIKREEKKNRKKT